MTNVSLINPSFYCRARTATGHAKSSRRNRIRLAPAENAVVRHASDAANPMPRNPAFHINVLQVVLARAGDFASDRAGDFSLSEGAIGGDARAPPAAMICCCQASPSAIMRSNAPRAQSWYACIRSTIVSVLHMRSEHSDADLVPVWRRSNQLFENVCILFKNLS